MIIPANFHLVITEFNEYMNVEEIIYKFDKNIEKNTNYKLRV